MQNWDTLPGQAAHKQIHMIKGAGNLSNCHFFAIKPMASLKKGTWDLAPGTLQLPGLKTRLQSRQGFIEAWFRGNRSMRNSNGTMVPKLNQFLNQSFSGYNYLLLHFIKCCVCGQAPFLSSCTRSCNAPGAEESGGFRNIYRGVGTLELPVGKSMCWFSGYAIVAMF